MATHRHAGDNGAIVWLISDLEDAVRGVQDVVAAGRLSSGPQAHIMLSRVLVSRSRALDI